MVCVDYVGCGDFVDFDVCLVDYVVVGCGLWFV